MGQMQMQKQRGRDRDAEAERQRQRGRDRDAEAERQRQKGRGRCSKAQADPPRHIVFISQGDASFWSTFWDCKVGIEIGIATWWNTSGPWWNKFAT